MTTLQEAANTAQPVAMELPHDEVLSLADLHADESREDGCRVIDRGGLIQFAKDILSRASASAATAPNLSCKSVQKRLADQWGYVPASAAAVGESPARADYLRVARIFARAYGQHDGAPSYLPRTDAEAATFEPHGWVIAAMMQAYADGNAGHPSLGPHPIATAPKDERVLLWSTYGGHRWFIGCWGDYDTHNHPRITLWSPLPPTPPSAQAQAEKGA